MPKGVNLKKTDAHISTWLYTYRLALSRYRKKLTAPQTVPPFSKSYWTVPGRSREAPTRPRRVPHLPPLKYTSVPRDFPIHHHGKTRDFLKFINAGQIHGSLRSPIGTAPSPPESNRTIPWAATPTWNALENSTNSVPRTVHSQMGTRCRVAYLLIVEEPPNPNDMASTRLIWLKALVVQDTLCHSPGHRSTHHQQRPGQAPRFQAPATDPPKFKLPLTNPEQLRIIRVRFESLNQ